jgi:hypothetical protein
LGQRRIAAERDAVFCLESLTKKFEEDVTNESRDHGDLKIGGGKNVSECPSQTSFLSHARAFEFPHQEIGIKEEHNKTDFDKRSPDIFHHRKSTPLVTSIEEARRAAWQSKTAE